MGLVLFVVVFGYKVIRIFYFLLDFWIVLFGLRWDYFGILFLREFLCVIIVVFVRNMVNLES